MALLTDEQLHAIREIVRKHHQSFVVNTIGAGAVPPEVLEELKAAGLVGTEVTSIEDSYLYGQAMAAGTNPAIANMSLTEFRNWLQANPIPLTPAERRAVELAQHKAAQYAVGLGNRIDNSIGETIIQADRALEQRFRDEIKDATAQNIARRESIKELVSDLRWSTKDWGRDWDRIAITEKHNAMQHGLADGYSKEHGPEVLVAKRPMPDACFAAGTPIITRRGQVPIEEISVGDEVLTHKLRWRRVTATMRRDYEGDLFGFNGRKPTATANHPVLLDHDWHRADSVKCGAYLTEVLVTDVSQADPALVLQQSFFGDVSGAGTSPRVPVSAVQLYRYLHLRDSDINIEFANSKFRNGREGCQQLYKMQSFRSGARQSTLSSLGFGALRLWAQRQFVSFARIVGELRSFFFGHAAQPTPVAAGLGRYRQLPFDETAFDYTTTDTESVGDALHRVSVGEHSFDVIPGYRDAFVGHEPVVNPRLEKVNTIATVPFSGMVYNFEVEEDQSYVADGLVVHNCRHCKRLHEGPDGQPIIFKLSELEANGTNFGRKAADWLPTVGAIHPHCQCQIVRIPVGWGFDSDGALVPGGELGVRYDKALQLTDELRKAKPLHHETFQGIPIAIETKKGQKRHWTDAQGQEGETLMLYDYGFIERTGGADAEEIDCYLGPHRNVRQAYVIHQLDPATGIYDEDKIFLGFLSAAAARVAFQAHRNDADAYGGMTAMEIGQLKRWISGTRAMPGHSIPQSTIPLSKALSRDTRVRLDRKQTRFSVDPKFSPETQSLEKGEARGGKYTRRVPYTDKRGKQRYRYYYKESAAAREAVAGEELKVGKRIAKVLEVKADGTIRAEIGGSVQTFKPDQWHNLLVRHYGQAYTKSAGRRARQTINTVLRHVPREMLHDLKGETDAERLADLKKRGPEVYAKLRAAFRRAGVSPFLAMRTIERTLERRKWEPEARALVIGSVMRHRTVGAGDLIRASESLAGGSKVEARHVAAVVELRAPQGKPEAFPAAAKKLAESAEKELAELSAVLARVKSGQAEGAEALVQALASTAIQRLNLLTTALPGFQDKVAQEAREIMPQVVAVIPRKAPTRDGAETNVYVAGEGGAPVAMAARYRLVEAKDLIASHKPESFAKHPDYPADVQERAYHRDKAEQAKVIRNAQRMNPQFVINTNPDAVNGPPLVTDDGIVLGGNSRVMSMQRVYTQHPDKAKELRKYLTDHAAEAGFTATDIEAMENPVLIREMETVDKSKRSLQVLVRQMNESFIQGMDPRTMQVAMGRKLTDDTLAVLANDMGEDQTLSAFLGSSKADRFISSLYRAGIIDARNTNQYMVKGTRTLNNDGKTLVSRILVGRTVNDADILSSTGVQMMDSIARAVPFMHQATAHGKGYDIGADLAVAVDGFNHLQARVDSGSLKNLDPKMSQGDFGKLFAQMSLLGSDHPVEDNPRAMQLLEVLVRKRGPIQMAGVFRDYARRAAQNPEGQVTMFGKVEPSTILTEVIESALGRGKAPEKLAASMRPTLQIRFPVKPRLTLSKAGPFIGPRGGKWADPQHKIPWKEKKKKGKTVEGLATVIEDGKVFETGRPVTFYFTRNLGGTAKSPPGDPYQQKIEPAGRYMVAQSAQGYARETLPGMIRGEVTFKNPLVLHANTGPEGGSLYDEHSWKSRLKTTYKRQGQALSRAIARDGYDGIVTVQKSKHGDHTTEIVDLRFLHTGVMEKAVVQRTTPDIVASGRVSTEEGGQTSPAIYRNPGHGTFPNFAVMDGNVGRHKPEIHPAVKDWDPGETSPGDVEQRRIHVDPDDYIRNFDRRKELQRPRPVEIDDQLYFRGDEDRQRSKDLREWLEEHDEKNRQRPRNDVEVES